MSRGKVVRQWLQIAAGLLVFALGDEFAQAVLGFHFSFDVMVFWKAKRGSPLAK